MRAVGEADGPGGPADLLHGDAVVHVAEPHPAVLLRRGEAVEVEVPHEPPQVNARGEAVGGVDRRGVRRDGLLREPVHALLELVRGRGAGGRAISHQASKGETSNNRGGRFLSDGARRAGRVRRTCSCVSSKRREDEEKSRAAPPPGTARRRIAGSHRCIVRLGYVGSGAERSVARKPTAAWRLLVEPSESGRSDGMGWGWGRRRAFKPE